MSAPSFSRTIYFQPSLYMTKFPPTPSSIQSSFIVLLLQSTCDRLIVDLVTNHSPHLQNSTIQVKYTFWSLESGLNLHESPAEILIVWTIPLWGTIPISCVIFDQSRNFTFMTLEHLMFGIETPQNQFQIYKPINDRLQAILVFNGIYKGEYPKIQVCL